MQNRAALYGALIAIVYLTTACDSQPAQKADGEQAEQLASDDATVGADGALIVAFGDSLFAGYRLENDEGFVPVLDRMLDARGIEASVHNAAVSGDTTAGGRQRLAFMLDGLDRKPDLVIVELGSNDMLRGLSPDATRENLTAILEELRQREIDVMLAGAMSAPNMGPDYAAQFNAIYPDLAERFDVPLYPFVLDGVIGNRALVLPDGIHPNAEGVEVMVDAMADQIVAALDQR